ncbi:MAG: MBL fold metallo-hydrolase [Gammaproteobacteria bacterium]|nr:MBL fold metallo-hydrolase [Gammaproteobacteria bacterium]
MIKVTIWGARGSTPISGLGVSRYGGNTPCVEVSDDAGNILIFDAGTGIRELGRTLAGQVKRVNLLLTHLHMDHIQGLGFFAPLFDPAVEVHIWGPASATYKLQTRLRRYLSPPLFPVRLRDLPAEVTLHELPGPPFEIGPFHISSMMVAHPGPTLGYRIETSESVVAYLPDHEPALGLENFPLEGEWTSGYALAVGADILIHDCQYSDEEYPGHIGWGHSAIGQVVKFAALAGVKKLVPFHHDPSSDDEDLDRLFAGAVNNPDYDFEIIPAVEGSTFEIGR